MKWFKIALFKWTQQGRELYADHGSNLVAPSMATISKGRQHSLNSNRDGMTFSVHKATGGHIVRFHTYNERTDSHDESLHIINDSEDFSECLGKIVFMECLRR